MFLKDVVYTHWKISLADVDGNGGGDGPRQRSWGVQVLTPLAAGALALLPGRVSAYSLEILNGVAIVTGLLFSTLIFLIQLRHQVRVDPATKAARNEPDRANIDNGFFSAAYAIVVGVVIIIGLILQGMLAPAVAWPWARVASNWLIYALFAHFLMTMWLCVVRLWRMYEVFGLNKP
ncbi:hypothetical protein [Tessaracoccus lapidicaptus]|uniref:hypothetical protein n=1 Tax=Tessaracoccus lapidicaptus TaxID=1427523 RepID=UPI0011466D43|nr:hypothetical protein [Tessaracoccus lapidicaptus]